MKKKLSVLLCLTLCLTMLAGCMGLHSDAKINADGSGTVTITTGLSEAALQMLQEAGGTATIDTSMPFTLNGKTYYGETETYTFANIQEFNTLMNDATTDDGEESVKTGEVTLENEGDKLILKLKVFADTGDTDKITNDLGEEISEVPPAMVDALKNDMAIVYDFEMPYNVIQSTGPINGVTVSGHKISLDLMQMKPAAETEIVYTFMSSPDVGYVEITPPAVMTTPIPETTPTTVTTPVVSTDPNAMFTDVPTGAWYTDAVNAAAKAGFVNGVGDGTFNPTGQLTYSAFCQILAKATSRPTGTYNGYWAYNAIKSCIDNGWITTDKEITPENFDVPIEREIAFGAAALARTQMAPLSIVSPNYSTDAIPDILDCSSLDNSSNVLLAYRYGLTKGVDAQGNFNPHGLLTRAEVCQMFYNVNWLEPI